MNVETVGRAMEVLLIEDSLVQAQLTYQALEKAQFEHRLTVILDGEDALDFLRRDGKYSRVPHPDLILLDLRLPKVDGLDVLAEIRSNFELQKLPVVILTSSEDDSDRARCEELHVDAYLTKPVSVTKFLDIVRDLRRFWRDELILPDLTQA